MCEDCLRPGWARSRGRVRDRQVLIALSSAPTSLSWVGRAGSAREPCGGHYLNRLWGARFLAGGSL